MGEPAAANLNIITVDDGGIRRQCVAYPSVSAVPIDAWAARWPHFPPAEVRCRGTGQIRVAVELLDSLELMRADLGDKPMVLVSVYRTAGHNRAVGGVRGSKHLISTAADVRMDNHNPARFEAAARRRGFKGFGHYRARGFMHIDLGPERWWGERWPANENVEFPAEAPQKPLAQSRTIIGAATAAVATAASQVVAGVADVAPQAEAAVREQRDNLVLLGVPVEWIGGALAALAVIGAAVAIYARWDDRRRKKN